MSIKTTPMIDGDPAAPILIVGMSPGRDELAQGRPLVGGSGRLLWALARRAGFTRQDCYIINTIGEWPGKKDGNPTQEQYEKYWDEFDEAIALSKARVAICLGGPAFERLTGIMSADRRAGRTTGINAWRGYLVRPNQCEPQTRKVVRWEQYKTNTKTHKKGDPKRVRHTVVDVAKTPDSLQWIVPTIHPASVLRSGYSTLPALAADLARAGRLAKGHEPKIDVDWHPAPIPLPTTGPVVFDIETRQTPVGDVIVRVGVATKDGCWTSVWDNEAKDALKTLLAHPDTLKVAHNIQYDLPRLEAEGVPINGPIFDTMLGAAVLQPDLYKGLNAVASLYLDIPRWKHLSDEQPAYYNALDAARTFQLYEIINDELRLTGQQEWFNQTIMPGARTLIKMSSAGMKVDVPARDKWLRELSTEEYRIEKEFLVKTGLSPGSPKQMAKLLYEVLGLPVQYGKSGGETADAGALAVAKGYLNGFDETMDLPNGVAVSEARAIITLLLKYREVSKLRSTYTDYPLGGDGCVHPSYLPAAKDDDDPWFGKGLAGTLRITTRGPNLQNQPPPARNLFVPRLYGHVFLEADFSQIELRIIAALSQDDALIEALKGDVHARTQQLLGCDRTRAKNVMYGTAYGAGPRKLAQVLRIRGVQITEREARDLQNALANAYPKMWAWRKRVMRQAAEQYYLVNPFGQRRYFYGGENDATAAVDYLPQGTAACIMWSILPPLWDGFRSLGGWLVNSVHDSVCGECPESKIDAGVALLRDVMERKWDNVAPGFYVPIGIKVGKRWGEMQEYHG